MNLQTLVQQAFAEALAGVADDPAKYAAMTRPTQNADHGDYQNNAAMPLAKLLGRKPPEVGRAVAEKLAGHPLFEKVDVAGPGFVNVRLKTDWLAEQVRAVAADPRLGVAPCATPKTVVIDYSGPNVAKPLHVGHLRSTIIGDALARLLRFLGHRVVTDNHLGDWGTQFGILLYGYKHHLDRAAYEADPVRELARLYVHVRSLSEAEGDDDGPAGDPVMDACRAETARLHAGDPENLALWREFMPHCLEELRPIYEALDVHFDHQLGESFYHGMLPGVVEDLVAKGVARESRGALIVAASNDEKAPVSLVRKGDGAFTYTTTDLATIKYRVEKFKPDEILYVVDFRQAQHFLILFAAARQWGYDVRLEHLSFGSVLGEGGKPLKTRDGGTVELSALLDEAVRRAGDVHEQTCQQRRERDEDVPDFSDEEKRSIAAVVGHGAVKYADLSQKRTSDYTFSFDKMLAMNGNTATYMQYAYARCMSIFRKAGVDVTAFRAKLPAVRLDHPAERALAVQLLRFDEALDRAVFDYFPHALTDYLWDVAKAYSGFFEKCPVIKDNPPPAVRDSRLVLCDLTARTIQITLGMLGIRTVERM
jgi:arginyl-tRNA synthetase